MSVEGNPPNPSGATPTTPVSMVAVYRHLIRMKRKLEDRQHPPHAEFAQSDAAQHSEGGDDVSG